MTVVLAKRFGDLIEVVSDTMISDSNRGREDAFPGRLKIITLAVDLTVAYAGHSDPALHAIRQLYRSGSLELSAVLHALRQFTASPDHDVEFLVVSHQAGADLRRVWSGQVSASLQDAALGDARIRSAVYQRFPVTGEHQMDASEFHQAFFEALTNRRVDHGQGVGGFPLGLKAWPQGHVYRSHSFYHSWKTIEFVPFVEQHEDPADMQTGDWTFHHTVLSPNVPGVPVLAAQIQQARRAYIYSPLFEDDPTAVPLLEPDVDWTEHQDAMNRRTTEALNDAAKRAAEMMKRIRVGDSANGK